MGAGYGFRAYRAHWNLGAKARVVEWGFRDFRVFTGVVPYGVLGFKGLGV